MRKNISFRCSTQESHSTLLPTKTAGYNCGNLPQGGFASSDEVRTIYGPFRSRWSWSSCGRQSANQFVWVSGLPLGPLARFYLPLLSSVDKYFILLSKAPSLTRKQVCSLQCNHSLVRLLTPSNHTLPSHLRLCSLR
jgi:hypothetical protein